MPHKDELAIGNCEQIDSRAKAKKKPHMPQPTKQTKIGLSNKRAPINAPEWTLKHQLNHVQPRAICKGKNRVSAT